MTPQQFIGMIAEAAMENMRSARVPASLTIAQAILESAWGESGLAKQANNLFGIKGVGPAGSVSMPTTEVISGVPTKVVAQFRAYHSWGESIADHTQLILAGTRDNPTRYHGVLGSDYRTASVEIWRGGYATDPKYPDKLIDLIERYSLDQYDDQVREEEQMLEQLSSQLEGLQEQVRRLSEPIPPPAWAQEAYLYYQNHIDTPVGTIDFWRMLTVQWRKETGVRVTPL